MKKIILASSSPRRKHILEILDLDFTVYPSKIEESLTPGLLPKEQVESLSRQKAEVVSTQFHDAIILAADTMVVLGDEIIGKPKDAREAKLILKKLSGTQHTIVTGFTLFDTQTKKIFTDSTETKIWFRDMTENEIAAFVEKEKPFDKAGGYAIHELAAMFIKKIEGDCMGATGLSVFQVAKALKSFGIEIL